MTSSSINSVADTLLSTLLQGTFRSALAGQNPLSLFLPREAFGDSSSDLSTKDLADLLRNTRGNLLGLSSAAERLDLANPLSTFFAATVSSSNGAVVTGAVMPGISRATTPTTASYAFTVSQLAVAEANVGTALTGAAANGFTAGTNTLSVTQNGATTNVSFTVTAGESNLTVLTNLATAINGTAGLGVSASVNTDPVGGTSQLIVQSKVTGTANAFTLANVANSPVTDAGIGSATTNAANASYTLNGVALSSNSNEFYLDSNAQLKVNLLTTSSSAVVLKVAPDTSQIANAVDTLVSAYNAAKGFFDAQADLSPGLVVQLHSAVSRNRALLANVGIGVDASGGLTIDTAKLTDAISQSLASVQTAFGDVGGLAKELHAIADKEVSTSQAERNPLPPFHPGTMARTLIGSLAVRLNGLHRTGLLVNALI